MNTTSKVVTFLTLLTVAIFFISNEYLGGYLSGAGNKIGSEISAPSQALYEWKLTEKAPFKYRMLFPAVVKGSWALVADGNDNKAFLLTYKFWSLAFLVTAVISFFFLLKTVGFSNKWSGLGGILFLLSPPVLLAYTLPVHTREDTLAYTLLSLGLLCVLQNRFVLFFLISILAVFCRETLLILPFIFLFYTNYKGFIFRAMVAAIPVGVWITIRLLMEGESYDPWLGLRWNLSNIEQVIGFSFVTFHFMWFLFFYGMVDQGHLLAENKQAHIRLLYRSGLAAFGLIVVTTFVGGIYNEIRLLFLLFPWLITISLHVIYLNKRLFFRLFSSRKYWVYCVVNVLLFSIAYIFLVANYQRFLELSQNEIHYEVWIAITVFYALITILFIPAYLKIINYPNFFTNEYVKQH